MQPMRPVFIWNWQVMNQSDILSERNEWLLAMSFWFIIVTLMTHEGLHPHTNICIEQCERCKCSRCAWSALSLSFYYSSPINSIAFTKHFAWAPSASNNLLRPDERLNWEENEFLLMFSKWKNRLFYRRQYKERIEWTSIMMTYIECVGGE